MRCNAGRQKCMPMSKWVSIDEKEEEEDEKKKEERKKRFGFFGREDTGMRGRGSHG